MAETIDGSPFQIQTQYVKDLSFENPNAPEVYAALAQSQPEVSINLDVSSRHLNERVYEVVLNLRVGTNVSGKPAFLVDLQYAALINVHPGLPEAEIEPLLLTEGPRFIFPFARATLANVTRDGGFPPLVINPIDFDRFYERNKTNKQTKPEGDSGATRLAAADDG